MPDLGAILAPGARLEKVAGGFKLAEGPVFSRRGYLLFSDVDGNRILKLEGRGVTVFRENSNAANGLTFDHQGRLLACERGRVTRTEKDGRITVLAGSLKQPNDLVYAIDGSVYFTDPPLVYLITRRGELRVAARDCKFPNGVALAPSQLTLYAADTLGRNVRAYEVTADGSLANGRVLAQLPVMPDGLKTDEAGNLYVAGDGLHVLSAKGEPIGQIEVPEPASNCNWGSGFRGLYITAGSSVYHIATRVPGTRTY